jgi:hypothetical protein
MNADSDGDGLSDGDEQLIHGTNPLNPDSDGDLLTDKDEIELHGTNPNNIDTDGDGENDSAEIVDGTDPLVAPNTATPTTTAGPTSTLHRQLPLQIHLRIPQFLLSQPQAHPHQYQPQPIRHSQHQPIRRSQHQPARQPQPTRHNLLRQIRLRQPQFQHQPQRNRLIRIHN